MSKFNEFIDDEAELSGDDEVSEDEVEGSDDGIEENGDEPSDEEEEEEEEEEGIQSNLKQKRRRVTKKNEFIDDEAELSGDDEVSEDEVEGSDDDALDEALVDKEAPELDSDEEEEVRGLYHKQLETEDKRAILLLQEQLEDKDVSIGQKRRRKFRWQTKELMDNSLRRHYDPDDDDSQEGCVDDFDDDDDIDYSELKPRLRRPTAESFLLGSTRIMTKVDTNQPSTSKSLLPVAGPSTGGFSDDSNSNTISSRLTSATRTTTNTSSNMNRFLFRDREIVEALSTKEIVVTSREEKDRVIQRELKRVLQSKSIFDQLYT